ncbi:MAG TPA: DUF3243 domain-containing protein [Syntrophomonadaceae bacterium]|nr:DUF3243 domain-containing protein [Syntrophomonadaceae bacterium]
MEINQTESFTDWEKWKGTLAKAVSVAELVGMSDTTIEKIGLRMGNILSSAIDPENREQRLLQELWKVGDDRERAVLTRLLIKMLQTDAQH